MKWYQVQLRGIAGRKESDFMVMNSGQEFMAVCAVLGSFVLQC